MDSIESSVHSMTDTASLKRQSLGLLPFAALIVLSVALVALASWIEGSGAWRHPVRWLGTLDQDATVSLMSDSAQVVAGMLAILITVVAIVLELSATRYTHRVTALFARDPLNVAVMTFFLLTTVLCIWLALVLAGEVSEVPVIPRGGFLLAVAMMTISMLALLPYFAYVFRFVSPLGVIARIRADALKKVSQFKGSESLETKLAVIEAVEDLEDVGRGAMKNNDRGIAMAAVESLATLLAEVADLRQRLPESWFLIDEAVARDPDFVALAHSALDEIARDRSWFEAKILRQYLALFGDAVGVARDVASMIAIHTRQLGERFARGQPALLELCQRAFHSYLRAAINGSDPRTAYFVLHQYRLLGETLLAKNLESAVLEVANRMRFYGRLAGGSGLPFLLEVAAYDIAHLVEAAAHKPGIRDALLTVVLTVDHAEAEHLLGVRRAQVQLATFFLTRGEDAPARRIAQDLAGERAELLAAVREELEREVSSSYWEINDRGANFAFLPAERRAKLDDFFAILREFQ
ncbi:MAG: DUF2254 domain-containing protein [Chromatiales bacterium]|nr:MAG: DUF2254 domain-containing protein [Chromatiales bacterium]